MKWVTRVRGTRRALCAVAMLALSACGGGGGDGGDTVTGGGGAAVPTADYFPLAVGNQWRYALEEDDSISYAVRVGERREVPGVGTGMLVVQENGESTYREIYVASASGLTLHAAESDANAKAFDGTSLLRLPARVGETWVQVDRTDDDGRKDALSVRAESTVVGIEAVDTPAGQFTDALRQRTVSRYRTTYTSGKAADEYTVTMDSWYAPGIGMVRSAGSLVQNGETYTANWLLRDYVAGALRSDAKAPTVQGVTPAAGPMTAAQATVSATFSEAVDPRSVTASTFTVTAAGGVPVAGTLSFAGFQVSFEPLVPWASGTYTATLKTGVTDRIGNPLAAPRQWQFTVDAQGPALLRTAPSQNSAYVRTDTRIELEFAEPPLGVSSFSLRLLDGNGRAVAATAWADGVKAYVLPMAPLERGAVYTLHVDGVRDTVGNLMPAFFLRFTTQLEGFLPPVSYLGGRKAYLTAIADLNADGRGELISATPGLTQPAALLFVGPAGGPQVQVDPAFPGGAECGLSSIATGDLDGDGRIDIAVGTPRCGGRLLLQRPDGGFDPGPILAGPNTLFLRAADLDGDGHLELIGSGVTDNKVSIWRRDTSGTWAVDQLLDVGTTGLRQVLVADLNGDGRPDIAALTSLGSEIQLLYQQPGGTFVPVVKLVPPEDVPWHLAAGDLDGDGRTDLLAVKQGRWMLFRQHADGTMAAGRQLDGTSSATSVLLADMNGDGRLDVLTQYALSSGVSIMLQRGDGTFAEEGWYAGSTNNGTGDQAFAVGDLDGDGRLDIATAGSHTLQVPARATPMRTARRFAR